MSRFNKLPMRIETHLQAQFAALVGSALPRLQEVFARGLTGWKQSNADNPLAGRLTNMLVFFQSESAVVFAAVQTNLRDDQSW